MIRIVWTGTARNPAKMTANLEPAQPGLSTPIDEIFFSERLEYRTIQNDAAGQEGFFQLCREDSFWAGTSGGVLIPVDHQSIVKITQGLQEHSVLYVFAYVRADADASEEDKAARKPIGLLNLSKPSLAHRFPHRQSELGIALAKKHRGKGYGSEILRWGLDWAFDYTGIHRLQLRTESWNEEAWTTYENVGFKREGILREADWFQGKWHDAYIYSILEHEWAELRKKR